MKVINLFGGPSTGKSTTASDLFATLKWNNLNVELVNEYAKEISWEKRFSILDDQLYIMSKQNRKLWRIKNQVDWAVTDSPLVMSLCYASDDYFPNYFKKFGHELWNYYNNINIFLKREKPFNPIGRHTNEEESILLDSKIKLLLDEYKYPYIEVVANKDAKNHILNYLKEYHDLRIEEL